MRALVILRRELRLEDNPVLSAASDADEVYLLFIYRYQQLTGHVSERAIAFMRESVNELVKHNLNVVYDGSKDSSHDVIVRCISDNAIDAVYITADMTPYSYRYISTLTAIVKSKFHTVSVNTVWDHLIVGEPLRKTNNEAYVIYGAFNKAAKKAISQRTWKSKYTHTIKEFKKLHIQPQYTATSDAGRLISNIIEKSPNKLVEGGRSNGLKLLLSTSTIKYATSRNTVSIPTTRLSAYIKFGCISVREVYLQSLKMNAKDRDAIIDQLIWRDYYYNVALSYPQVLGAMGKSRNEPLYLSHIKLAGNTDTYPPTPPNTEPARTYWKQWISGNTGFPLADAGMRELNATGYMHNRARLVSASVLIKDLHIDWRLGEAYFAKQLTDYDPAINNGNWRWVLGEVSSRPPQQSMNPTTQLKYDPSLLYVRQWILELRTVSDADIKRWSHTTAAKYPSVKYTIPPDHNKQLEIFVKKYYNK
jgi:deoxyribodipyrimidine photo-lyase